MKLIDFSGAHGPHCNLRLVGAGIGGIRERLLRRACDASPRRLGVDQIDLGKATAAAKTIRLREDELRRVSAMAGLDR